MRILVAPDKFKDCLSAVQAARVMAGGVRRAAPEAVVRLLPLADGGEGTGDVLGEALGGIKKWARVGDPLGRRVRASWMWFPKSRTALVELAQASGLWRLNPGERNPLKTSTYGTGELILAALGLKPKHLWIAVGGSATVDGGAGLLCAVGEWKGGPEVSVLCDVENSLTGPRGAARAFGPQKGATPADVAQLERGLATWGRLLERATGRRVFGVPRMGAAGGAAAGLAACLGARLLSGAEEVLAAVGFARELQRADLVLTGEGAADRTSVEGKIVGKVIEESRRAGVPVLVLTGRRRDGWRLLLKRGARAVEEIAPEVTEEESMREAGKFLARAARRVVERYGQTRRSPSRRQGRDGRRD